MNVVVFVPCRDDGKLLWHLADSDIGTVRGRIERRKLESEVVCIYEMYCHDENSHLVRPFTEVCDQCGKEGTDENPVFESTDPYEDELSSNPSGHISWWCKECYHQACMDI